MSQLASFLSPFLVFTNRKIKKFELCRPDHESYKNEPLLYSQCNNVHATRHLINTLHLGDVYWAPPNTRTQGSRGVVGSNTCPVLVPSRRAPWVCD